MNNDNKADTGHRLPDATPETEDKQDTCDVCNVYPKQNNKCVCVKCEGMGFIAGDIEGNDRKAHDYMTEFNKLVNQLFPDP